MAETVLIRTKGGPLDGETRMVSTDIVPWPFPETLPYPFAQGSYVKHTESALTVQEEESHLLRGATYLWIEANS